MSDIFLSYASGDRERVRPLVAALTAEGWSVFWDRITPVGRAWHEVLEEELSAARSIVVIWSENSIRSSWVREEVDEGKALGLPLFPVLLDEVKPPFGYRGLQAADLSAWDGAATTAGYQNLVRDMQQTLGQPGLLDPLTCKTKSVAPQPATRTESTPEEVFTNTIGMTFVLIPAGTFQMGSPVGEEGRSDNELQHQVTLSRPFHLQTTPVTQGQWERTMDNNPSYFDECGADCPVENVSWYDIQKFLAKLNQMEKTDAYRLPIEAEWEYACRAGNSTRFCWGDEDEDLKDYAWYSENSGGKTHRAGKKKPNVWGLYDMHGNVWEWCQDWYGEYPAGPVIDPPGPDTGTSRVLRGGSWGGGTWSLRSAVRNYGYGPGYRGVSFGFRVVRTF
jgi:formylglycine-generating enzyme required for sulfatase activity